MIIVFINFFDSYIALWWAIIIFSQDVYLNNIRVLLVIKNITWKYETIGYKLNIMQAYNFKKLSTIHALCKIHLDAEMEKVFMYNNISYEKKFTQQLQAHQHN